MWLRLMFQWWYFTLYVLLFLCFQVRQHTLHYRRRAKVNVEEERWDISSSSVCFQQNEPCRSSLRSVSTVEHSQKPQIIIGLCVLWPGEEIYWIWLSDIHGWALLMEQMGDCYTVKLHCNKTACWTSERNMSKFHTFKSLNDCGLWWRLVHTNVNADSCGCLGIVWRMSVCVICSCSTFWPSEWPWLSSSFLSLRRPSLW